MKNYSDEIFVDKLRSIKFPDYSKNSCVNDAYQDFATRFLFVIDSVSPVETLRVKSNTKPWFDTDALNAILKRDKHFKKFKQLGKEADKDNFKYVKPSLKKILIINNKKIL